jgi:hypothetical protein
VEDEVVNGPGDYERITLDNILYAARVEGRADDIGDVRLWAEREGERLIVNLRTRIHGMADDVVVVEWPATWWQHVKQRFAPRWALRRWPVRMDRQEIQVYKSVCPHIGAMRPAPIDEHFRYFTTSPTVTP